MTERLEKAIAFTRTLSPELQDELARLMMIHAGEEADDPVGVLSADEDEAVRVGIAQADRGRFASDDDMRALWAKYGR